MSILEQWQIEKLESIAGWEEFCEDTPEKQRQRLVLQRKVTAIYIV